MINVEIECILAHHIDKKQDNPSNCKICFSFFFFSLFNKLNRTKSRENLEEKPLRD